MLQPSQRQCKVCGAITSFCKGDARKIPQDYTCPKCLRGETGGRFKAESNYFAGVPAVKKGKKKHGDNKGNPVPELPEPVDESGTDSWVDQD